MPRKTHCHHELIVPSRLKRLKITPSSNTPITVVWDGATYHRDVQCQGFLAEVNQGLEEQDWLVTCLRFAQTAPESNYLCKINLSKDEFGFRIYLMSHHYSADLNRILSQFQFEADDRIRQTFAGRYEQSG